MDNTPKNVYEAVVKWAGATYGFGKESVVRPFAKSDDYTGYEYPIGCVVVDNAPFSMLSRVIRFYNSRKIRYFLFAPTLTCFTSGKDECNYVITDATLTMSNNERVRTSFVTNMGDYVIYTDGALDAALTVCEEDNTHKKVRKLQGIDYPIAVATTANISAIVRRGVSYRVKKGETKYIAQVGREKQSIFGGGMLLSRGETERKEFEARAAESMDRQTRKVVELSPTDLLIQSGIGGEGKRNDQMEFGI